ERFTRRHVPSGVDEDNAADAIACGQRLRHRASELARTDDRDCCHRKWGRASFQNRNEARPRYSSGVAGKVAVVTGGSRGIGHATARALLARGVSVVVSGTDARTLTAAEEA